MNHLSYHDSAARSSTAVPQPGGFLRRSAAACCPPQGRRSAPARNGLRLGARTQPGLPEDSQPRDAARAPGQHPTTLCTTPSCSLMNQSVINARRLFRVAGSMLNIHVKEQKHSECKCLHSSEPRGHIYILIVENYKAKRSRRIAPPRLRHAAGCAPAAPGQQREAAPTDLPGIFFV